MTGKIAEVHDLRIAFEVKGAEVLGTEGMSLEIRPGEILGLVGESGSGKSLTALALAGLLPEEARVEGRVTVLGTDMLDGKESARQKMRGGGVSIVFQNPGGSLTPWVRIGIQMTESLIWRRGMNRAEAEKKILALLPRLGLSPTLGFLKKFPHELSGGMRQRVALASALSSDPALVIADEPTTALDVLTQAEILEYLQAGVGPESSLLLITHDLKVAASICTRLCVAYAGRVVESGPAEAMRNRPHHPYTQALWAAASRIQRNGRLASIGGVPAAPGTMRGCAFHPRCPKVFDKCIKESPNSVKAGQTMSRCFL